MLSSVACPVLSYFANCCGTSILEDSDNNIYTISLVEAMLTLWLRVVFRVTGRT